MGLFGLGCGKKVDLPVTGSCGDNITWEYDSKAKTLTLTGSGDMNVEEQFPWRDYKIKHVIFDDNITSVCKNCFYSNHYLTGTLKLPAALKRIEDFALRKVKIEEYEPGNSNFYDYVKSLIAERFCVFCVYGFETSGPGYKSLLNSLIQCRENGADIKILTDVNRPDDLL